MSSHRKPGFSKPGFSKPGFSKPGFIKPGFIALAIAVLACAWPWAPICLAQAPLPVPAPNQPASAAITGTVVDPSGAVVAGANVRLIFRAPAANYETRSDANGQFSFANLVSGPYQLTITSTGFSPQTISGVLSAGQVDAVPPVALAVAPNVTDVVVGVPTVEVAEEQLKVEEKQRVLAIVPNFYVSYIPNAAPLTAKQKFKLATKTVIDPFTLIVVAGTAGVEQAQNHFIGYGQGAEGYAKRFGAGYADTVSSTFVGGAILPAIFKQDPRYFYKGTGGAMSRIRYAIAMSVMCKGDNRRWQVNYSNILGELAAGGISNLYYPSQDRNGASLTFENAAIGIAAGAVENIMQEFVVRRLTPKVPKSSPTTP